MGRWLVILSLAFMQCSDAVMASSSSSDVPLWKKLLDRTRLETVRTANPRQPTAQSQAQKPVAGPQAPQPVIESQAQEPAGGSQAQELIAGWQVYEPITEWSTQAPVTRLQPRQPVTESQMLGRVAGLQGREPVAVWQAQEPARSDATGCSGGRRIVSAFYSQGQRTASGQRFDPRAMAAAHRTLPFGTRLTVTNPRTGKSVTVVVNDRGPFVSGVSLDLTLGAAQAIGMHGTGTVCIW